MATLALFAIAVMGVVAAGQLPERQTTPVGPSPSPSLEEELPPPTEGRIAFISNRGEGPGEYVFVMRPDGSDLRPVTTTPNYYSGVSWSPDGDEVVVARGVQEDGWLITVDLVIIDISTGQESILYTDEGSAVELNPQSPAWSPDGSQIAFHSDTIGPFHSGTGDLYVINVDGTGMTRLVRSSQACINWTPEWSPDGSRIAFARVGDDCPGGLFVVTLDDGELQRLTDDPLDSQPAWSLDGERIAFSREDEGGRNIFVVDVASGEVTRVTEEVSNFSPSWSPDGDQIVFASNQTGTQDIWVMNADGTQQEPITFGEYRFVDLAPAWSPP